MAPRGRVELTMNRLNSDSVLLARILDLADDAIITTDLDQRIQYFNAGAERTFGYAREEVFGEPVEILIPAGFRHNHANHVKEFAAQAQASRRMGERREIFGLHKNGTQFPAEASISKAELDGTVLYMVILRDITARREAEFKIHQSLREKEALLQEIHHRVKNNLQVVSSQIGRAHV